MPRENIAIYISTNATTHVQPTGSVIVHTVVIPKTTTGSVTFQSTAASAVTYFVLPTATIAGTYTFNSVCGNGLDVVTSASDVVIVNVNA